MNSRYPTCWLGHRYIQPTTCVRVSPCQWAEYTFRIKPRARTCIPSAHICAMPSAHRSQTRQARCAKCKAITTHGTRGCRPCRNKKDRERNAAKKGLRHCATCGQDTDHGTCGCNPCANKKARERRAAKKGLHHCATCGQDTDHGTQGCKVCRNLKLAAKKGLRHCPTCGNDTDHNASGCQPCYNQKTHPPVPLPTELPCAQCERVVPLSGLARKYKRKGRNICKRCHSKNQKECQHVQRVFIAAGGRYRTCQFCGRTGKPVSIMSRLVAGGRVFVGLACYDCQWIYSVFKSGEAIVAAGDKLIAFELHPTLGANTVAVGPVSLLRQCRYPALALDFQRRLGVLVICQLCGCIRVELLELDHDHNVFPLVVFLVLCKSCNVAKAKANDSGAVMREIGLRVIELERRVDFGVNTVAQAILDGDDDGPDMRNHGGKCKAAVLEEQDSEEESPMAEKPRSQKRKTAAPDPASDAEEEE